MDGAEYAQKHAIVPPRFTIDLSAPPRERYRHVVANYIPQLRELTGIFDELLLDVGCPSSLLPFVRRLARIFLRKVGTTEETEELRGISDQTGICMYLLVSLNVVLDLLMGCTSGGVQSLEARQPRSEAKMLHFRTLDWTMDGLRKVIVQLDYVRTRSANPTEVLASSITYVGFVGMLTAVRLSLSVSLNFRAIHDGSSWMKQLRFYFHHLLVLLGQRQSVSTILRSYMLNQVTPTSAMVAKDLSRRHTTAAYITLCDGDSTIVIEKDFSTACIRRSQHFVAITNHDVSEQHQDGSVAQPVPVDTMKAKQQRHSIAVEDIIEESEERLDCIEQKWRKKLRNSRRPQDATYVTTRELINWTCSYPITNECTHFATIMDPRAGIMLWSRAWPSAIE